MTFPFPTARPPFTAPPSGSGTLSPFTEPQPDHPVSPAAVDNAPCHVNCYTCSRTAWSGGRVTLTTVTEVPFGEIPAPDGTSVDLGDPQQLLTEFADATCARDDCPHKTAAVAAARDTDPVVIAQRLAALTARVDQLRT